MLKLASLRIKKSRRFKLLFRRSCTGKELIQKSRVHQVVANCSSCNKFQKFQKFSGPPLLLRLVWFSSLIWSRLFLCLDWSTTCFNFSSNAWKNPMSNQISSLLLNAFSAWLNRKCICLFPRPLRMDNRFWLRWFSHRPFFGFASKLFITSSSAVADGKLLTLPITILAFDSHFDSFVDPVSLGLPPLRLRKALSFLVVQSF